MFPIRFFARRYFPERYFPPVSAEVSAEVHAGGRRVQGAPQAKGRIEQHAGARGRIIKGAAAHPGIKRG